MSAAPSSTGQRAHGSDRGSDDFIEQRRAPGGRRQGVIRHFAVHRHQIAERRDAARLGTRDGHGKPFAQCILDRAQCAVLAHHEFTPIMGCALEFRGGGNRSRDECGMRLRARVRQAAHEHRSLIGPRPQILERSGRRIVDDGSGHPGLRDDPRQQLPPDGPGGRADGVHSGVGDHRNGASPVKCRI